MTSKDSPALDTIGNYDLLEKIGGGAMGTVYKGRHWETKQLVAIKVLHAQLARNPVLIKRFEQEFRITSKLDHPNVVRALEYSGAGATPYLVMELVDGMSLGEKLEREVLMPEEDAIRIIVQIAHGLHRAHRQGLIHRDVKPDNILVTTDNKAKLLDLGLAKDSEGNADLTRTGRGLGTPDFMAPEQFRNAKNASIRCDVYSLAATLYQMVTGKLPFDEDEPVKAMVRKLNNDFPEPRLLNPKVSERTDWAIRRAMSANPDQRPASCREFAEDLLGQSTRPGSKSDIHPNDPDVWYMVFTDSDGMVRTAKGNTRAIQNSLRDREMGNPAQVRASRCATGPFEPLSQFPEFRDLVVAPAPGPPLSEMSIANLSRLGRQSAQERSGPARPVIPTPPRKDTTPAKPAPKLELGDLGRRSGSTISWWMVLMLIAFTAVATLLVSKYLLPGK